MAAQGQEGLKPAHTPGPWEVRFRFGRETTVSGRQRYPICDTGTAPLGEANHAREEANARLIAAAPDLLNSLDPETLEAVADEIDCFEHSARAASLRGIAKRQREAMRQALSKEPR